MNQFSLNAIALFIALMTGSVLLGPYMHLPQAIPATLTLGLLGLATLDAVIFQSRATTLVLDGFAQLSPQYRQRIIHHEAGHLLTAQLLDIPVLGYSLSAWEALRQGHAGQGGVQVEAPLDSISQARLSDYCTVWIAGSVAESLIYNNVEGGQDDQQTLRRTLKSLDLDIAQQERQASRNARRLLQAHWSTYEALVAAMTRKAPLSECCELIYPLAKAKSL